MKSPSDSKWTPDEHEGWMSPELMLLWSPLTRKVSSVLDGTSMTMSNDTVARSFNPRTSEEGEKSGEDLDACW